MNMRTILLLTLFYIVCISFANSQEISPSEFVINSTIKVESIDKRIEAGKPKYYRSSGTGFFFTYKLPRGNIPVIVTNKHVIKDAEKGTLYFKVADTAGHFSYNNIEKIEIGEFKNNWILHPDTAVDLAILPIAPILNAFAKQGKKILYAAYTEEYIPNDSIRNTLTAIEDVLMIGYPFGLRDNINDLPVVRKGITATPPFLNYNSIKEFLCDLPVYPGSSGSPVIIFNPNTYTVRQGGIYIAMRLLLLGINYATYTRDFQGKIIPKASYNIEDSLVASTPIPYNIGIVIKSERLLDFKPVLEKVR